MSQKPSKGAANKKRLGNTGVREQFQTQSSYQMTKRSLITYASLSHELYFELENQSLIYKIHKDYSSTNFLNLKSQVNFVLFLDCNEETCVERCLGRGRKGDTVDILKARFVGHYRDSIPVVEHFEQFGLVRKINTNRSLYDIFEDVKNHFSA